MLDTLNPERYVYNEHGSKTRNGGFYQLSVQNKNLEIHKDLSDKKRCLVSLLDLYFAKLPQTAKAKYLFYCRQLTNYTKDRAWYSEQPRGKPTALFQSDAPEKNSLATYLSKHLDSIRKLQVNKRKLPVIL